MDNEKDDKKSHRVSKSGRKAEKKKLKDKKPDTTLTARQRNPKAFAIQNAVKAERFFRRSMDIKVKKQHIPQIDQTPLEPPPIVVAIVGPPKVGKSTLMRCLVKNFTRQNLSNIKGPVTVVSGKKKRLTILECNNDINVMIDVAKVADLVLLLVDASFGFEMEIFEFLNICQHHGMPRVMGVLTHLDYYRDNKQLRKMKKSLKHRFWTEIYDGAKLFYLSGMIRNEYQNTEIHNLGRFISVMKTRPLDWRTAHPYLLADRMEDLTDPGKVKQNPKCDRIVCFYGYGRGTNFRNRTVHIPGVGDFVIKDVSFLPDPCPLPDKLKKRSLNEKEKLIYAPFAGVGGIVYDKDAVYIDVGGSHSHNDQTSENAGILNELMASLADSQNTLNTKIASSELQFFKNTKAITSEEAERNLNLHLPNYENVMDTGVRRRKVIFDDETEGEIGNDSDAEEDDENRNDSDDDEDDDCNKSILKLNEESDEDDENERISDGEDDLKNEESENDYNEDESDGEESIDYNPSKLFSKAIKRKNTDKNSESNFKKPKLIWNSHENSYQGQESTGSLNWKNDLARKAATAFYERQNSAPNLRKLIYRKQNEVKEIIPESTSEELGGLFTMSKQSNPEDKMINCLDCSKFIISGMQDWRSPSVREAITDCFVTGKWKESEDAQTLLDKDDRLYGDFEDLEADSKNMPKEENSEDGSDEGNSEGKTTVLEKRLEKKKKLKEHFNMEYDKEGESSYYEDLKSEFDQQAQLNKSEFSTMDDNVRVQLEGYRPGMYLRMEISDFPCEFVTNFDPNFPVIIGGLQSGEDNIGYVNVKFKKHRWHKKTLKTSDPVIISLGWRRFQTLPLYSMLDHNGRCRLVKYTPEHLHCFASFFGPVTPQKTGCIAIQSVADATKNFRIAATGVVTELDKSTELVKKLKLTGKPHKIYKKTALITGMFNSSIEVTKYEGAAIKTVSGIRGQIKKACSSKFVEGAFRATFEDKILMSDIVFMRAWAKVQVPHLYNPVTSMLLPPKEKSTWRGMRTVGQLRRDLNIPVPFNADSIYKPVERIERTFAPIVIPRRLQSQLPYRDKPKTLPDKKASFEDQRVAVIQEPHEKKVTNLMKMIKSAYQNKQRLEKEAMKARVSKHKKVLEANEMRKNERQKEDRKRLFRVLGKVEKKKKSSFVASSS